MLENSFKTNLVKEIKEKYPGSMVMHLDAGDIQGIPDLIVLYENKWATLEGKKSAKASYRPNQEYYIEKMNDMSFSSVIFPENKDEVMERLDKFLRTKRRK